MEEEVGPYIKDTEGKLYNPKLIKPVPPESKSVRVPRWLQETGQANRDEKREQLWPWARRIHPPVDQAPGGGRRGGAAGAIDRY